MTIKLIQPPPSPPPTFEVNLTRDELEIIHRTLGAMPLTNLSGDEANLVSDLWQDFRKALNR